MFLQEITNGLHCCSNRDLRRTAKHARGQERESNGGAVAFCRQPQGVLIRTAEKFAFPMTAVLPDRPHRMDDITGMEAVRRRNSSRTRGNIADLPARG